MKKDKGRNKRLRFGHALCGVIILLLLVFVTTVSAKEHIQKNEWKLIFSDDFNRSDVFGNDWVAKSGKWTLRPAEARGRGPNAVLMSTRRFQMPLRIEYECFSNNPCDLSLLLRSSLNKNGYFVGFGSHNNTENKIETPEGKAASSVTSLIEHGKNHKVVVEITDKYIRQIIDGREILKAASVNWLKIHYFGFYIWNEGSIGPVKVYSTRALKPDVDTKKELSSEKVKVREFWSFNSDPTGIVPSGFSAKSDKRCSVKVIDVPTWMYHKEGPKGDKTRKPGSIPKTENKGVRFVSDHCIELNDKNEKKGRIASVTLKVPAMSEGLIEFDIMAEHYEGKAFRIVLADNLSLLIDKDGTFFWEVEKDKIKLRDIMRIHGHGENRRFYLWPKRWYTIRIDFDTEMSLANVIVVKLYNTKYGKGPLSEYFPLGEDLSLPVDNLEKIRFETVGKGRFYLDNVFMINRTPELTDEEKWKVSARQIMDVGYPGRKDPAEVLINSRRNMRIGYNTSHLVDDAFYDLLKGEYPVILESARKYNVILISQAFLSERFRDLERAYYYTSHFSKRTASAYKSKMNAARRDIGDTLRMLNDLYKFYASCYLDQLNEKKLKQGFEDKYNKLRKKIDETNSIITKLIMELQSKAGMSSPGYEPYDPRQDKETGALTFSQGAFIRDGSKRFLFSQDGKMPWPSMDRELMLSLCYCVGPTIEQAISASREPQLIEPVRVEKYTARSLARAPGATTFLNLFYGIHNNHSMAPKWWLEKHKNDPDIFLRNIKGEAGAGSSCGSHIALNYWNPEVLKMHTETLTAVSELIGKNFPGKVNYASFAGEPYFSLSGRWETGYNKTAVKAFHEYLRNVYGNIKTLNRKWRSNYVSFDEIQPPEDAKLVRRKIPSGLTYEFERFRQKSWFDWMRVLHNAIKTHMPNVPCTIDFCEPFFGYSGEYTSAFDPIKVFETFDIILDHNCHFHPKSPFLFRYLDSLNKVFNKSTGTGEWYISGPGTIFDEQASRNDGLRQGFQLASWGRSVLEYWLGSCICFMGGGNWSEPLLGHTVLRYYAGYIPLSVARARANEKIFLECPTVESDVGLFESQASCYNSYSKAFGNRSRMLEGKGHNYSFLFEDLVIDGRQSLDNYKVILLSAKSMPDSMVKKLIAWVQNGGILIASEPPAVWNEFGVKDGRLMDMAFGQGKWNFDANKGTFTVEAGDSPEGPKMRWKNKSGSSFLVEEKLGNGSVFVINKSIPEDVLYDIISEHAPRRFYVQDLKFQLIMRDGKNCRYLSLLNADPYKSAEDEIVVKGNYKAVSDINSNFPIHTTTQAGYTRFKIQLAPCEGTVIQLKK